MTSELTIRLGLRTLRRNLAFGVVALVVLTFIAQVMKYEELLPTVSRFIDSDQKLNVPSVFKELVLLASALTTWAIATHAKGVGERWSRNWLFLAFVIGALTLDEMTRAHQSLSDVLHRLTDLSGPLRFGWVIVYIPVAVLTVAALAPFWWHLAPRLRRDLALAGLLFGGGSAGVEVLKGVVATSHGESSGRFYAVAAVSDSLEMIGLALLLAALVGELARRTGVISLSFGDAAPLAELEAPLIPEAQLVAH